MIERTRQDGVIGAHLPVMRRGKWIVPILPVARQSGWATCVNQDGDSAALGLMIVAPVCRLQGECWAPVLFRLFLAIVARILFIVFDCRASALAVDGGFLAVAFDVHLDDDRVMDQAIDGGDGHGRVREHLVPLGEGLVSGDQHASSFVSSADQFEQDGRFGLILSEGLPVPPPRKPGRPPTSQMPETALDWVSGRLLVTGPANTLAGFTAAARGAGVTPWVVDYDRMEEDAFHLAVSVPPAERSLSVEGCRTLARQYREKVQAHQARAAALVGRSTACPFDLHALLPVPDPVLALGPAHPETAAWLATNWGVGELRHVELDAAPRIGRRLPAGHGKTGYAFFACGDQRRPEPAVTRLEALWPLLTFRLRA